MPIIITASDDMNNSVMITGVRNFQNRNRRGAVMKMNNDGVKFVSYTTITMHIATVTIYVCV